MSRKQAALLCTLALWNVGISLPVGSAEKGSHTVEVTANRAQEEAKTNSQSVSIITAQDIAEKQAKSVEDIIFQEVGVSRTVDAMGRVGVSIRGADPRHTLILIDGQPILYGISKYRGAGDEMSRIGAENIERIEIIRGASSARYGADAIGGVINIITKKSGKAPRFNLNVEVMRPHGSSTRVKDNDVTVTGKSSWGSDTDLYKNYFFRGDLGEAGKLRGSFWWSKRDIMPIYPEKGALPPPIDPDFRSSLRFYGTEKSGGVRGEYSFNKDHKLVFSFRKDKEDVKKADKYTNEVQEPVRLSRREMNRDSYDLSYTGRQGKYDWAVDINYGDMKEDNASVITWIPKGDRYQGTDILMDLNDIHQTQWRLNTKLSKAVNEQHYLTLGLGYSKERGEGSRIPNAPSVRKKKINPDEYWPSLFRPLTNRVLLEGGEEGFSLVHDPLWKRKPDGKIYWDVNAERYGETFDFGKDGKISYDDFKNPNNKIEKVYKISGRKEAWNSPGSEAMSYFIYMNGTKNLYHEPGEEEYYLTVNGKYHNEEWNNRKNVLSIGTAEIKKWYTYLEDRWQLNDNTLLNPILRLDHSDHFGSHATLNLGMVHNMKGNPHRRFKVNVGTGYAEPGLGELYYNWRMFPGDPGWYWIGNRDLKPEKSVNVSLSLEGENERAYGRLTVFHNRIRDYLTYYFTGNYMDTGQIDLGIGMNFGMKDRLYSFRNLGHVEISGVEAEWKQKFNKHWGSSLGYTYLHTVNQDSEENGMPRQLLDRPQHKIDIGLNYDSGKSGWSGAVWGDYYLNMLDGNSVDTSPGAQSAQAAIYKKKSYNLWNVILRKTFASSHSAYVGVNNLFNHRDDDRAFGERTYRLGFNFNFDSAGEDSVFNKALGIHSLAMNEDWFLPKEETVAPGEARFSGSYRSRWQARDGQNRPGYRITPQSKVDTAGKNADDAYGYGHDHRLQVKAAYGLGNDTEMSLTASSGDQADNQVDIRDEKGLGGSRLEKLEVKQKGKSHTVSAGRLQEPIGLTGYFFGQSYDGIRGTWRNERTEVRVGYGKFHQSTGITDSAYNRAVIANFLRGPNKIEFTGLDWVVDPGTDLSWLKPVAVLEGDHVNYYNQYKKASEQDAQEGTVKHRMAVLRKMVADMRKIDKDPTLKKMGFSDPQNPNITKLRSATLGLFTKTYYSQGNYINFNPDFTKHTLVLDYSDPEDIARHRHSPEYIAAVKESINWELKNSQGIIDWWGNPITSADVYDDPVYREKLFREFVMGDAESLWQVQSKDTGNGVIKNLYDLPFNRIGSFILGVAGSWNPGLADDDTLPFPLENAPAEILVKNGTILVQDNTPPVERAAFVQVKRQLRDNLGVQAHYFRALEDSDYGGRIANVAGVGAALRLGKYGKLSWEYGRNASDFGRWRNRGSLPGYWVARLDVGRSDPEVVGSWNVFLDHKAFDPGAYLGGTGAEAVPDRYLDGIKSWTAGFGYVPAKNWKVEGFYTFDSQGLQRRATLFGSESFRLGDYARVQLSYQF